MEHLDLALVLAAAQLGAALAILAGIATAIGQGHVVAQAIESTARQPEARGAIMPTMFIGLAMCETSAIYGLVIAMLLLFANPIMTSFLKLAGLGG